MLDVVQFLALNTDICKGEMKNIWSLVGTIVFWFQIAIPVIIVLLGTIDLAKAVFSGDDKKVKEAQSAFIKRLIYGAVVFFVVLIVQLVFGAVANGSDATGAKCFDCVAKRGNC